jgi:hypothetical protein
VARRLELTRTREHRRMYALEDVGTLRLDGLFGGGADVAADGRRWRIGRRGLWRSIVVTDAAQADVGAFHARLRGGGTIEWDGREYVLRRASVLRERYALVDGDRELALLDARSWGKRPVAITIDDPSAVDAGLLLFAAFLARKLASDADSAAGSTTAAVTAG